MTTIEHGSRFLWHERAKQLAIDGRLLLNGQRHEALNNQTLTVRSPRNGQPLGDAAACDQGHVDAAVRIARHAQQAGTWSRAKPSKRKAVLMEWADRVEQARDELALLICTEMGKPIRECAQIDVPGVVRAIRWYAELADKHHGSHPETGPHSTAWVSREPAGVVAAITPWNFPLASLGYDVAPALMLGNSVIVKPSEQAPFSVLRACTLGIEAGLPAGVLSGLPGHGHSAGAALGCHPDIDVISITGSPQAGRTFLRYSAQSNGKRVWPELGGKSTVVVCEDVPDVRAAATAIVWGAYFNQGQMCTGAGRVLVHRRIRDKLLTAIDGAMDDLTLGDPLNWETHVGPLVSTSSAATVLTAVDAGVDAGGTVLRGGREVDVVSGGHYLEPTLVVDAPTTSPLFTQEVFGPVAAVHTFDDLDEARELIARSEFGMAMSIWTRSIDTALRASKESKVGTVWVNCFEADDLTVPAGGVKQSGYGRTKGFAVLEKYSDLKTTWVQGLAA